MVQLTSTRYVITSTFGMRVKGKMFNHRKPIRYKRFQRNIVPQEFLQKNISRHEQGPQKDPKRTYGDARVSLDSRCYLLDGLTKQQLEANQLFTDELKRQRSLVARVEDIKVEILAKPFEGKILTMKKAISSPFDCAKHLHELFIKDSVVAEVQNVGDSKSIYWDMSRPLETDCKLKLKHFIEEDVSEVNKIYWRSCSFLLGMAIRLAFRDEIKVLLHSWPKPTVKSGSFVYDVALGLKEVWKPNEAELRSFTKVLWRIRTEELPFDRLEVTPELAKEMFADNFFKKSCIDDIAEKANSKITVYRCGGLLDISIGPMISNTSQVGRIALASVHNYESTDRTQGVFYRFQGVSLPDQLPCSSYLFQNMLINKARPLNRIALDSK